MPRVCQVWPAHTGHTHHTWWGGSHQLDKWQISSISLFLSLSSRYSSSSSRRRSSSSSSLSSLSPLTLSLCSVRLAFLFSDDSLLKKDWTCTFVSHSLLLNFRVPSAFLTFLMSAATWAGSAFLPVWAPALNLSFRNDLAFSENLVLQPLGFCSAQPSPSDFQASFGEARSWPAGCFSSFLESSVRERVEKL